MRIYLDESKKLGEWKIVFGWFITKHSHSFIENKINDKKLFHKIYWDIELKWSKTLGKFFYEKISKENDFQILNNSIIWININWYFKDDINWYKKIMEKLVFQNINYFKNYKKDIFIIADNVNFWKKTRNIELEIEKYLNNKFNFYWKIRFNFSFSKNNLWIQLADIISYKLWKSYFYWEKLDDFILENLFNIDIFTENNI